MRWSFYSRDCKLELLWDAAPDVTSVNEIIAHTGALYIINGVM